MLCKNYFNIKNITTGISNYLPIKDIVSLSHTNKYLYTNILNPEINSILNTNYRDQTIKKYFDEDFSNKTILIDDYKVTNNNWLKISRQIEMHSLNFPDKKISGIVYELFNDHLYLSDIRKSDKFLEFEYSDEHQDHCYDWLNQISFYYYNYKNEKFGTIGKKLFYEEELINYENIRNEINNEEKEIIEQIFNYKIDDLKKYYINNKNSKKLNQVLFFVLWLIQACYLFCNMLCNYLVIFDDKKLIEEYVKMQKYFMQFSKAVSEKFKNVNLVINLLYKFNNPEDNKLKYFSLYDLLLKIMKINMYDKLKPNLMKQISEILRNYFKELLDKKNIIKSDIAKTDIDMDFEFDEENYISLIEKEEMEDKKMIERYTNCILDLNIHYLNASLINHTNIKLKKEYNEYENLLLQIFVEEFNQNIIKLSITDINNMIINFLYDSYNELKIIRRTKNKLLRLIDMYLSNYIFIELKKEFKTYISIGNYKGIKISKILPEENYLNFLSAEQNKNVKKYYEEQIENLKLCFKSEIMKKMPDQIGNVEKYFEREDLKFIVGIKNLIWISSFLIGIYNERNEIIFNLIKKRKNNEDCILNEIIA